MREGREEQYYKITGKHNENNQKSPEEQARAIKKCYLIQPKSDIKYSYQTNASVEKGYCVW